MYLSIRIDREPTLLHNNMFVYIQGVSQKSKQFDTFKRNIFVEGSAKISLRALSNKRDLF